MSYKEEAKLILNAKDILRKLLDNFFINDRGGLEVDIEDGLSIRDIDESLEIELIPYLTDSMKKEYREKN